MKEQISILIADDHLMFADGIRLLLDKQSDLSIIGEANNGKELLTLLEKLTPDILLLDINMPQMNGLNVLNFLAKKQHNIKILMLSTYGEKHLIEKARAAGASGYIIKNFGPEELIKAIHTVFCGGTYFPLIKQILNDFQEEDVFLKQFNLTKREMEIILLIKQHKTNLQISEQLFLSIYTVETHRKNIMGKLGLHSPAALMEFIIAHQL